MSSRQRVALELSVFGRVTNSELLAMFKYSWRVWVSWAARCTLHAARAAAAAVLAAGGGPAAAALLCSGLALLWG